MRSQTPALSLGAQTVTVSVAESAATGWTLRDRDRLERERERQRGGVRDREGESSVPRQTRATRIFMEISAVERELKHLA